MRESDRLVIVHLVYRVPCLLMASGDPSQNCDHSPVGELYGHGAARIKTRRKRTNVPSLREDDAQEEDDEQNNGSNPAIRSVRGRSIEVGLVLLQRKLLAQGFPGHPDPANKERGRRALHCAGRNPPSSDSQNSPGSIWRYAPSWR
jgi:hypothetical protein